MPKKTFDVYETASLRDAGVVACQYLDTVGKTDMAELSEEEWLLFFAKFMGGYEDSMKKVFDTVAEQ